MSVMHVGYRKALPVSLQRIVELPQSASMTEDQGSAFLHKAQSLQPTLTHSTVYPKTTVHPVKDGSQFLRWRMDKVSSIQQASEQLLTSGEALVLDFGKHITGYFSLLVEGIGSNIDSPIRLEFRFGEVPGDIAEPLTPYRGTLSESWLPIDQVDLENPPLHYTVQRRHAFRWISIRILACSTTFKVRLSQFAVDAISSVSSMPTSAPADAEPLLQKIDEVSLATLHECMQTVFEDGPRRDQRLWLGDLRVQALTNYVSFRNFALVKRCLYLLTAFPQDDGMLRACVFEKPEPHASDNTILDYAALFAPTLLEYTQHSHDLETSHDLYPVMKRQLELAFSFVNQSGIFGAPKKTRIFIDWRPELERTAAMHGVLLYSLRKAQLLAELLGYHEDAATYQEQASRMSEAALIAFYDSQQKVFVSGANKQLSWASAAWLVLAGVGTRELGAQALSNTLAAKDALRPSTPYLYHYVAEALILSGQKDAALKLIRDYWGGMIRAGADTFWEVYDPSNSLTSPYADVHVNSFCHAWSCGPSYLLRRFFWNDQSNND